ncbi:MAG: hypothetical protein ACRBBP_06340 [Bdellovibrionales bacterium]
MRGYPFVAASLFLLTAVSPRQIANIQRLYLSKDKIVADRTSPAFSAIEDAFVIKEFLDHNKPKPKEEKKINLKGLKVSLKAKPLKLEKINLKGERIGVAHFTSKFLVKKNIQLSSNTSPVKNLREPIITTKQIERLSSAEAADIIELPSGVSIQRLPADKVVKSTEVVNLAGMVSSEAITVAAYSSNVIKGSISLEGEGNFFGEHFSYYINRSLDGKIYESGVVDADQDTFEMEVGSTKGILSVELRSEKGDVLAYGEQNLEEASLKNLRVTIFPSETLLTGRVLSSSESVKGFEKEVMAAEKEVEGVEGTLKVDEEGYFNEDLFEKGSSFIVETKSKNYWSDLNFGVAGKPLYPRLIKKKEFAKFARTLDPFGEDVEVRSAIVGSVTQKGFAQQNIKVRLFSSEYQKPVYFNPNGSANPSLTKTTTNGGFIFINVPDGGYLVQAVRGTKVVAQKWYLVREGRISQGQLNIKENPGLVASAEIFPRSRKSETFSLYETGIEDGYQVSTEGYVQVSTLTNPELLSLRIDRSEEHTGHIYLTSAKARKKNFRVVKQEWLDKFLNNRRSNANRAMGFVVGFINQNDFKVVKETTTALSSGSQIFYFDKYGDATESGRVGGGFIITEVSRGLKSVVVSIKGRETFLNRVVMAKPYSISIF